MPYVPQRTLVRLGTLSHCNVASIFKVKGSVSDPSNHRPISLTSVTVKCMEMIVEMIIIHGVASVSWSRDLTFYNACRGNLTGFFRVPDVTVLFMYKLPNIDVQ